MPKREVVIRISEQVQALNRVAFVSQQAESGEMYRDSQRRIWQTLGLALAASLAIGLLAILYAADLEKRIRRRRQEDARHAEELQRLSAKVVRVEEEGRRKIARELHDEVGQVLTAVKVELAVAQRAIDTAGGAKDLLNGARSVTESAIATVRDLSHLLHPAVLDDLGLASAVEWHLRNFSKRHGLQVDLLQDRMDERFTAEIETTAYRIIQEGLTNIVNHAHARVCRVYLQHLPDTLLITIEDDGVGFDTSAEQTGASSGMHRHGGLGLIGIRERVTDLRGTLRLESTPGKGTRLTVELPTRPRVGSEGHEPGAYVREEPVGVIPQSLDV
jgi:signal transduction histidine kinase